LKAKVQTSRVSDDLNLNLGAKLIYFSLYEVQSQDWNQAFLWSQFR